MKTINLSKLQNAEHLALMTEVLNLVKASKIAAFEELKGKIEGQVAQADAAQLQIRKSKHTEDLVALDEKRDGLYRGLVLRLQSELFSNNEEAKNAAKKLQIVLDTYGNFTRHNYLKETTEIENLVADLKSAEYLPLVKKSGLEEWVTWLETANTAFYTLYASRRDDYASQPNFDLKNIRKELDVLFRKVHQTADALAILQPSEALNTFVAKLNVSIEHWSNILAQREGRKGKKGEDKEKTNDISEYNQWT